MFAAEWGILRGRTLIVGRAIGWILIVTAVAAAGHEGFSWLLSGSHKIFTFGEMWAAIDRGTLNLFQAGIQRHVAPWLWEEVILRGLLAPAWLMLAVPGGLLAYAFRSGYGRHSILG